MIGKNQITKLLPEDNEITSWKRDGNPVYIKRPKVMCCPFELIKYGVVDWVKQKYLTNKDKSIKLELMVYRLRHAAGARKVYELLGLNTKKIWWSRSKRFRARINPSFLFEYLAEFRKGRYFGRLIIENKSPEALSTVKKFLQAIKNKFLGI